MDHAYYLAAHAFATSLSPVGFVLMVSALASAVAFQFAPLIVAVVRNHPRMGSIATVNVLLGWTGIGWVAALIWSLWVIDQQPAAQSTN